MGRYARISVAVLALLLLVVGSALANRSPVADEDRSPVAASQEPSPGAASDKSDKSDKKGGDEAEDAADTTPPSQAQLDRLIGLLKTAGVTATDEQLTALIAKYGIGGAMRVLAWAHDGDTSQVTALRDQGLGWGEIARQLNEADSSANFRPGIGWIMSGGHGGGHADAAKDAAKSKAKPKADDTASAPEQTDQP